MARNSRPRRHVWRTACAGLGVRPGERVAVLMDSRFETMLVLFGILRAGAVAVPLNVFITERPWQECAQMPAASPCSLPEHQCRRVDACGPSATLDARHFHRVRFAWRGLARFPGVHGGADRRPTPAVAIAPDDECNLIYSSGTTALPKGIVHTHACRMHWAYDRAIALRYRSDCRTLCSLGLFSNISWVAMLCDDACRRHDGAAENFSPRDALGTHRG